MKYIALIATLALVAFLVGPNIARDLSTPTAGASPCAASPLAAGTFAREAVRGALKAPDTASFSNVAANPDGECRYMVAGQVSAQNGFGAAVAHSFSVPIIFDPAAARGWTHEAVVLSPR